MDITNTLLIVLLALGSVQGVTYGIILLNSRKVNRVPNAILATILFFFSYRLLVQVLRLFGLGYYDTWYYFMLDYSWVHGPLLFFYVKAQLQTGFKFQRRDLVHFIPFIIQICFSVFVRLQNLYWDGSRESLSWLGYWGYIVWMNLSTIYFVASILIIIYAQKASGLILKKESSIVPGQLNWLKRVLMAFKIYFGLVLIVLIIDLLIIKDANFTSYWYFQRFYYYPFFIGISLLTYWLGLEGYKRKDVAVLNDRKNISPEELRQLQKLASTLHVSMTENKWYKDPELTLNKLADHIGVKPYLLTRALNTIMKTKFSDYVNELRVEEVKTMVNDPENDKYTLLSLALDSGFNSKSSFNRAVKKHLGIAPSELKSD